MRKHRFALITIATIAALSVVIPTVTNTAASTPTPAPTQQATEGHPQVEQDLGTTISGLVAWSSAVAQGRAQAAAQAQLEADTAAVNAADAAQVQAQQAQLTEAASTYVAPASTPSPGGWQAVAICEEGGANDPTFGYYGIEPSSWNDYDGVSTAGQADQSTQLAWEAANVGSPPDESGGCHGY